MAYEPHFFVKFLLILFVVLAGSSGLWAVVTPELYADTFKTYLQDTIGFGFTHGYGNLQTWGIRQALSGMVAIPAFYYGDKGGFAVASTPLPVPLLAARGPVPLPAPAVSGFPSRFRPPRGRLSAAILQVVREIFDFTLAIINKEWTMAFVTFGGINLFGLAAYMIGKPDGAPTSLPSVTSVAEPKKKKFLLF